MAPFRVFRSLSLLSCSKAWYVIIRPMNHELSRSRRFLLALFFLALFLPASRPPELLSAPGSAYDLIGAVNSLRQARGLSPFQVNAALMSAAQGHSDYQASIGQGTHYGPGGNRPRDRAAAAGFGGGAAIFISENIAWGGSMTYQRAVEIWQGDDLHLNTMLGPNYTDVGAGVATSGGVSYFTLDAGYVAGSPGTGPTVAPVGSPAPTVAPFFPVATSTANPDGSLYHTVRPGQALWNISAAYHVSVDELRQLNNLSSNLIYVGQKLLVRPATSTLTITPTLGSEASTPTLTRTLRPLPTGTPSATAPANPTDTPPSAPPEAKGAGMDPLLIFIILLVLGGVILIVLGNTLKRAG